MEKLAQMIRATLVAVLIYPGDKGLVNAADDSLIQPYLVSYGNLTCHRCLRSVHGYNCIVLRDMSRIEREHCRSDQQYCMVEKYITNGVLQTFTRGCAKECIPGCDSAGVNYIIEKCYSCCKTHFCNVGNRASGLCRRVDVVTSAFWAVLSRLLTAHYAR